jgi:hypothetical protein
MRSFAAAENVRRWGRGESSGEAADGGGTVGGLRASLWPAAFFRSIDPLLLGITTMSFSYAQVRHHVATATKLDALFDFDHVLYMFCRSRWP